MSLNHRTAVITGASRGLGAALATEIAQHGARVVLVARASPDLDRLEAGLLARGHDAVAVPADVGDPGAVEAAVDLVLDRFGEVDVLVNNASTLGAVPLPVLLDLTPEALERTLAVNVLGPFRLVRRLARGMVLRGEGTIVNISSDAAVNAYPSWGGYGASKAALDHLTGTWAAELEGTGVRVVAVDPGEMDTAMHRAALPDADPSTLARPEHVARRIVAELVAADRIVGSRVSLGGA